MVRISRFIGTVLVFTILNIGLASHGIKIEGGSSTPTTPTTPTVDSGIPYVGHDYGKGYTLIPADELGTNTITKYVINKVTKYYDPTTGQKINTSDIIEDSNYIEVTL